MPTAHPGSLHRELQQPLLNANVSPFATCRNASLNFSPCQLHGPTGSPAKCFSDPVAITLGSITPPSCNSGARMAEGITAGAVPWLMGGTSPASRGWPCACHRLAMLGGQCLHCLDACVTRARPLDLLGHELWPAWHPLRKVPATCGRAARIVAHGSGCVPCRRRLALHGRTPC